MVRLLLSFSGGGTFGGFLGTVSVAFAWLGHRGGWLSPSARDFWGWLGLGGRTLLLILQLLLYLL